MRLRCHDGYVRRDSHGDHPCRTCRDGVFICGATQGPKEIGELVVQACAAAANVAALLAPARDSEPTTSAESVLLPVRATNEPVIISFCCSRCAYPGADAAGSAEIQYLAYIRIVRTVCSGMIHPNVIMDALTQGADGVLLCGCHPGNCRSREGIRKAQDRKEAIELMLEDFGLEP